MTVTQIEPFYKGKGRVAIYLNNEFAFVLYKGELSKYKLEIGSLIDDVLYEKILNETLILRAKKRGMNLLMKMDRTKADVRNKLKEGGYPPKAIDACIEYLESFQYLDDRRYASDYINAKKNTMSNKQITAKLVQKGISKSIIEESFLDIMEEDPDREIELIAKLINKKIKTSIEELSYADKQKLYAYLYNKGFSVSNIDKAINSHLT